MPRICYLEGGKLDGLHLQVPSIYSTIHVVARIIHHDDNSDLYKFEYRFVPFDDSTQYWFHSIDNTGRLVYKPYSPQQPHATSLTSG